jgi:hypothetical protein
VYFFQWNPPAQFVGVDIFSEYYLLSLYYLLNIL